MSATQSIAPYGYCQCGCGQRTQAARQAMKGYAKGEPQRFVRGHWARVQPRKDYGPAPDCKCGCGNAVIRDSHGRWRRYAPGHYSRSRRPAHPRFVDTDPGFWGWFAGFVDGEGCFGISLSTVCGKAYPQPYFKLTVRADELPILREIEQRLGCGRIKVHQPGGSNSNPQLSILLTSIADCQRLIEVLTLHPLRAKKRRDFVTWAEAVAEKAKNGTSPRIWELREKLMSDRQYDPTIAEGGDAK